MSKSFVKFAEIEAPKNFKTKIWDVTTLDKNGLLGQVKWFGQFRCYAFFPAPNTVFDKNCLTEIAAFTDTETSNHTVVK